MCIGPGKPGPFRCQKFPEKISKTRVPAGYKTEVSNMKTGKEIYKEPEAKIDAECARCAKPCRDCEFLSAKMRKARRIMEAMAEDAAERADDIEGWNL